MLRKIDVRFLLRNDIGKDAPTWIESLLYPFNRIIQFLIDAFNGNISVQNLNVQTLEFSVTAPFILTRFAKSKGDRVYMVMVAQILKSTGEVVGAPVSIDWFEENNSVVVSNIFGLTTGQSYQCKLAVLYF